MEVDFQTTEHETAQFNILFNNVTKNAMKLKLNCNQRLTKKGSNVAKCYLRGFFFPLINTLQVLAGL